jgi:hypothetical protein
VVVPAFPAPNPFYAKAGINDWGEGKVGSAPPHLTSLRSIPHADTLCRSCK